MPDLLLEIYSEEIPARMQQSAAQQLATRICESLEEYKLSYKKKQPHNTPRRLVLHIEGVDEKTKEITEERRGPKTNAPEQAITGFMKSCGLSDISQAEIKGEHYFAIKKIKGKPAIEILPELIENTLKKFQWPKSMKWGEGNFRWVRPIESILCLLGEQIVPFEVGGIKSANKTRGHRFYDEKGFKVASFADYEKKLKQNFVILSAEQRKQAIKEQASKKNPKLKLDEKLLDEVTNLVEYPVLLEGEFDKSFLQLPPEIINATISEHQKCFVIEGENKFLMVANLKANDGGMEIKKGNTKVVNARLADAKFFYEADLAEIKKHGFKNWQEELKKITFHNKLGSQAERVERIVKKAKQLAPHAQADTKQVAEAAQICKADLCSAVVGEFPKLQGIMGSIYYSKNSNDNLEVAQASQEHYRPQGPSDSLPSNKISIIIALSDKFDLLEQFWKIDEKPTGSKDPFALRRAALGIIRIILENKIKGQSTDTMFDYNFFSQIPFLVDEKNRNDIFLFLFQRLKFYWLGIGYGHDLIDAVMAEKENVSLINLNARIEALHEFMQEKHSKEFVQSYKRINNILSSSEMKKPQAISSQLLNQKEEKELHDKYIEISNLEKDRINNDRNIISKKSDFEITVRHFKELTKPLSNFFDNVLVNDKDEKIKNNRLSLLWQIKELMLFAADFSKIEG